MANAALSKKDQAQRNALKTVRAQLLNDLEARELLPWLIANGIFEESHAESVRAVIVKKGANFALVRQIPRTTHISVKYRTVKTFGFFFRKSHGKKDSTNFVQ